MTAGPRQVLQTAASARKWMRELLQTIFVAELIAPSRCLWVVSPWLRDIPVLDNTTGAFQALSHDFPRSEIRLTRLLIELLERGTHIVIATRPEAGNRQVIDTLRNLVGDRQDTLRLDIHERSNLHAKGIAGDRYCLGGSMNITFNALENLTELLVLHSDPQQVETMRLTFLEEYGGKA